MKSRIRVRVHVGIAVAVMVALVAIPAGASKTGPSALSPRGSWPYPNANLANTRVAPDSLISSTNVSKLREAWTFKLTGKATESVGGYGTLAVEPVVVGGTVYLQDLHSNVYALSLATGTLDWEYQVNRPEKSGPGPNGVAVADGVVYGATPTTVFALNAATGKRIWRDAALLGKGQGTFGIQPEEAGGRVFLASQYGLAPGGGVLLALKASNGSLLWKFNTLRKPDAAVTTLGVGAGGAWETPLVSSDGTVTFGIGNPYQSAGSAIAHPARLLYTDSDVTLDAATGKLRWYYQGVPDDFKDYDMQASPISASTGGTSVVIGGGKMGYVYEMNASTGALIWKTPVGQHNGHDEDSLKALQGRSKLTVPFTYVPGALGGILTNLAVADGTVYVATCNLAFSFTAMTQVDGAPPKNAKVGGTVEALNLATGKVEWATNVSGLPLGAATVSNDLVFTTLFEGKLIGFDRMTGAIVYTRQLPRTTNSAVTVAGNTVLVAAGGPLAAGTKGASQLVAYTLPGT
jgi:alcohol dehydrogenase (cytochrome c)